MTSLVYQGHIRGPLQARAVHSLNNAAIDHAQTARTLKAAGHWEAALEAYRLNVLAHPQSAIAEHNLAALLGDLSRFGESADAARRAIAKGGNAPETWLVLARALQGIFALDEAETAYEAALARRTDYLDAHQDLAQLRWMRSGDLAQAAVALDKAIADEGPNAVALVIMRGRLDIASGDAPRAAKRLEDRLRHAPADPALRLATAQASAAAGNAQAHLDHAVEALKLAPSSALAAKSTAEALLGLGRTQEAGALCQRILAQHSRDQGVRALLLTAQRLLGEKAPNEACEEDGLVRQIEIPTPTGWPSREAWMTALAHALRQRHGWKMHPPGQSLRGGSQTQEDLSRSTHPAIAGLFAGIRLVVARYIAELGPGEDPTRQHAPLHPEDWRFTGAWSVLLRPGGHHIDHVHPEGWLSSAFHVETPPATERDKQGWLAFGRPGCATTPTLGPCRYVKPIAGHLVLFPSYLWHGTEPFEGTDTRLTVAFDIVPGNGA